MCRAAVLIAAVIAVACATALPPSYILSPAFSLKNPGTFVAFDLKDPNNYLLNRSEPYVRRLNGLAVNNAAKEIYAHVVMSTFQVVTYDATDLTLKNVTDLGDFCVLDMRWDPKLNGGTLLVFGGTATTDFYLGTLDLATGKSTNIIEFHEITSVDSATFSYDYVNHRFIFAGTQSVDCVYVTVSTLTFEVINRYEFDCYAGPNGDRTPDNAAYSPATNQIVGFVDQRAIITVDADTFKLTKLFDVSEGKFHRIYGPSLLISDPSGKFDTYYSVMSSGAPVYTHLIAVTLPRNGKPTWKALPTNPTGDILNVLALVNLTAV